MNKEQIRHADEMLRVFYENPANDFSWNEATKKASLETVDTQHAFNLLKSRQYIISRYKSVGDARYQITNEGLSFFALTTFENEHGKLNPVIEKPKSRLIKVLDKVVDNIWVIVVTVVSTALCGFLIHKGYIFG